MARLRVTISPGCRGVGGARPLAIDKPGDRIIAGRTGQLRLPHVSGADNEFLSGRAVGVGLDQTGRPYLVNLSASHELILRPWALGTAAEASMPPRQGNAPLQPHYLERGAYWVRNGRHWHARYARFGTALGDDRTSWVLIQVDKGDPLARLLAPSDRGEAARGGSTVRVLAAPEEWDLSEAQMRSVLVFFSEFLAWPPRVTPRVLTETAAAGAVPGSVGLSRLDHLVSSAKRRGFVGDRTDLLPWLVANQDLTLSMVSHATTQFALERLLLPECEYRPPE